MFFFWRLRRIQYTMCHIVLVFISFRSSRSVPLYHTHINQHVVSAEFRSHSDMNAFPRAFWFITSWRDDGCGSILTGVVSVCTAYTVDKRNPRVRKATLVVIFPFRAVFRAKPKLWEAASNAVWLSNRCVAEASDTFCSWCLLSLSNSPRGRGGGLRN